MKKRGFTLIEMMAVIVILGIISIVVMPLIINKVKNKQTDVDSATRQLIYNAAALYIKDSTSNINSNSTFCVPLTDLVNIGYLSDPISSKEDIPLSNVVKVIYSNTFNDYEIVESSNCVATNETEITVSDLKNKANSNCNVSNKQNCVNNKLNQIDSYDNPSARNYPYALSYAYMGSTPSNLIILGSNCYSIIGITNDNSLKLIYEGVSSNNKCETLARNNLYTLNSKWFNEESSDNFSLSLIKTSLDEFVNDTNLSSSTSLGNITLTSSDKSKLVKAKFYIGIFNGTSLHDLLINEKESSYEGYVGLVNSSDFIITSSNSNCSKATSSVESYCNTNNFMVSQNNFWTLNNTDGNNAISISSGIVSSTNVTESLLIRPVIYLNNNVRLSGNGTSNFPYIVK